MGTHWMTTLAGLGAILSALGPVLSGIAAGDWSHIDEALPALAAGVGLILAKDANK